jgi:hypothetical protein
MASANFDELLEQVKSLSVDEQWRLRTLLDTLLTSPGTPPTEEEFARALIAVREGKICIARKLEHYDHRISACWWIYLDEIEKAYNDLKDHWSAQKKIPILNELKQALANLASHGRY